MRSELALPYDVADMRRRLDAHIHWYNHARTHHALGGLLVPADRYYGRVEEVLARIEAGANRDASDLLDLRHRCLELFKLTSRGGVPETWLLGRSRPCDAPFALGWRSRAPPAPAPAAPGAS